MILSNPMSMRVAAAAGSLALAVSAIAAPVALAQDADYQPTLDGLAAAIEAKDFESLPMYFCEEQAAAMGGLDFSSMEDGAPPGMDVQLLLDALDLNVDITSTEEVSRTDLELVVAITGSMSMEVDPDKIGPFIEALLTSMGEEVTPDMVAMFSGMMASQLPTESTDISSDITMTPGVGLAWLICSDLTSDGADEPGDEEMVTIEEETTAEG